MAYKTINPFNNEVVKEYDNATKEDINKTLEIDDKLYHQFKKQPISERAAILHKIADLMRKNEDDLAKTMVLDMGKLIGEARVKLSFVL